MTEIIHATGFAKDCCPRHFVQMVFQCHGMRYEFQAFIQTAVRLDVEIFCVLVRDVEQLLRVAVYRAAVIDFELDTEMTQTFAVEYKVGRVIVLVNNVTMLIPAGRTVGIVVVVPIGAVAVNNAVAVFTADVILIKAVVAEYVRIVFDGILLINPLGTVVADYGQTLRTVLAEPISFRLIHILNLVLFTAVCTNPCFVHCLFLHFI